MRADTSTANTATYGPCHVMILGGWSSSTDSGWVTLRDTATGEMANVEWSAGGEIRTHDEAVQEARKRLAGRARG